MSLCWELLGAIGHDLAESTVGCGLGLTFGRQVLYLCLVFVRPGEDMRTMHSSYKVGGGGYVIWRRDRKQAHAIDPIPRWLPAAY